jgi:hypothetical protein
MTHTPPLLALVGPAVAITAAGPTTAGQRC